MTVSYFIQKTPLEPFICTCYNDEKMKKPAASQPTNDISSDPTASFATLTIGRDFLNTLWRMATPVLLFAGLGIVGDKQLGTKPWLTLLGMLVGFFFASLLIKKQLRSGSLAAVAVSIEEEEREEKK